MNLTINNKCMKTKANVNKNTITSIPEIKLDMKYTNNIEYAKECAEKTKKEECENHCSYKSDSCFPKGEIESKTTLGLSIQTHTFNFNSRVNGEKLTLVKSIPFLFLYKAGFKPITHYIYYITIYEYKNMRCICFPPGTVKNTNIKTLKYYINKDTPVTLSEIINELIDQKKQI